MDSNFEPYYVVIFTSKRSDNLDGYEEMNQRTFEQVESQPGFMGYESFSNDQNRHVSIVKFRSQADIAAWRMNPVHMEAQKKGKDLWYDHYNVKICKVEREYEFNK